MLEREQYHAALEGDPQGGEEESGELEVFGGEEPDGLLLSDDVSPRQASGWSELEAAADKGKGKGTAKAVDTDTPPTLTAEDDPLSQTTRPGKRRRPVVDPFAGLCSSASSQFLSFFHLPHVALYIGYGDDPGAHAAAVVPEAGSAPSVEPPGTKAWRHKEGISTEASSGTNTPSGGEQQDRAKKSRKRSKKKGPS
jgi:hypothetical protein